jgi:hygromycin-B 4-O-kinase
MADRAERSGRVAFRRRIVKTRLTPDQIASFLNARSARAGTGAVDRFRPLVEGEERQVFAFRHDRQSLVIRIAPRIRGFLIEAYVSRTFGGGAVPIPEVFSCGQIDENHAFCITPLMPGTTLQDTDSATIHGLASEVEWVLNAIHALDPGETTGFGSFDQYGTGAFSSWRAFLAQPLEEQLDPGEAQIDRRRHRNALRHLERLIDACPDTRQLVHGDFGSNNVLTDGNVITGVLDWESALFGDPLYDQANILYWAPWLACMRILADRLTRLPVYRDDPGTRTRLHCYQLHIGVRELTGSVREGDSRMLRWHEHRISDLVDVAGNVRAYGPN